MRLVVSLAALLVWPALLAGCSSPPAEKNNADEAPVELADGTVLEAGAGLLEGVVRSDAGLALPGVHLSILGTDLFADSDERGGFWFVNLTAGEFQVQARHPSYQNHIHPVTVPAGTAVFINITLLPIVGPGVETHHTHDMWAGQTTYLLVDREIDLQSPPWDSTYPDEYWAAYNAVVRPNVASPDAARWPIPLSTTPNGGPGLVLPGTARMTVTLTWSDPTIRTEGFGFCYNSALPGADVYLPVQATSPASFSVELNASMADSGHQPFSLWSLWLSVTPLNGGTGGLPDAMYGNVRVVVVLEKGEILADPPHRDFWADGNERLVLNETRVITSTYSTVPYQFYADDLVPPGTTRMRIEHAWTVENAVVAQAPREYRIYARTAAMDPATDPANWFAPAPTGGSAANQRYVYEFDVKPVEVDGYYQSDSFWRFAPVQPRWGAGNTDVSGVPVRHVLNVTAIRVP